MKLLQAGYQRERGVYWVATIADCVSHSNSHTLIYWYKLTYLQLLIVLHSTFWFFYCRFVSFSIFKEIFVSFRFQKPLLKTTSTISFSNQNNKPETCHFVFRIEKTKTLRQNVIFFHRLKKNFKSLITSFTRYIKNGCKQTIAFIQNI